MPNYLTEHPTLTGFVTGSLFTFLVPFCIYLYRGYRALSWLRGEARRIGIMSNHWTQIAEGVHQQLLNGTLRRPIFIPAPREAYEHFVAQWAHRLRQNDINHLHVIYASLEECEQTLKMVVSNYILLQQAAASGTQRQTCDTVPPSPNRAALDALAADVDVVRQSYKNIGQYADEFIGGTSFWKLFFRFVPRKYTTEGSSNTEGTPKKASVPPASDRTP